MTNHTRDKRCDDVLFCDEGASGRAATYHMVLVLVRGSFAIIAGMKDKRKAWELGLSQYHSCSVLWSKQPAPGRSALKQNDGAFRGGKPPRHK